jgi:hypothetical protein
LLTVKADVPELVTVTRWSGLVSRTLTLPKASVAVLNVMDAL